MPKVTVAPLVLRTTSDPEGVCAHGVMVGTGPIPETALENLATEAERQAEQLAAEVAAAETCLGDVTWSFHVIGVRLTAGPGPEPWAALGTLVSAGEAGPDHDGRHSQQGGRATAPRGRSAPAWRRSPAPSPATPSSSPICPWCFYCYALVSGRLGQGPALGMIGWRACPAAVLTLPLGEGPSWLSWPVARHRPEIGPAKAEHLPRTVRTGYGFYHPGDQHRRGARGRLGRPARLGSGS
jgi:hypothetical protein